MPVQTSVHKLVNEFNFSDIHDAISLIHEYWVDPTKRESLHNGLITLKNELNRFFKDSNCLEVIYTDNTDKMFFGMCVFPFVDNSNIYDYIQGDKEIRISGYFLELDSKLFAIDFEVEEIVAILLHEIGHIVNDATPINRFKKNMMKYMCSNGPIRTTGNINYREILAFGIKDSIRKMDSIFCKNDEEIIADEFVVSYGYGNALQSALEKIIKYTGKIPKDIGDKFLVMSWTLRLYNDILQRRIPALYQLRKMVEIVPSYYERKELKNLEVRLRRIDDDAILGNYVQEASVLTSLRRKGIRGYEDDFYELTLQARAVQKEDDALILMHKINSRISIIEDFMENDEDQAPLMKRWDKLLQNYMKLRDMLANKALVKDDYSRIYVNYPTIRDQRDQTQM